MNLDRITEIRSEADLDRAMTHVIETAHKVCKWFGEYKNRAHYDPDAIALWAQIYADLKTAQADIAVQREAE